MTKSSAVQHQDAADGAKDADECIWLLPASDLERWTKPLRGRFNSQSL